MRSLRLRMTRWFRTEWAILKRVRPVLLWEPIFTTVGFAILYALVLLGMERLFAPHHVVSWWFAISYTVWYAVFQYYRELRKIAKGVWYRETQNA